MDREIVVDYDRLEQQLAALGRVRLTMSEAKQLDGLFELLQAILEQKPFKEGKD